MKKRTTRTIDVLDRPVDFMRFGRVRRNAFAGAGEHGGPSLLSLWRCRSSHPTPCCCDGGTGAAAVSARASFDRFGCPSQSGSILGSEHVRST